MNLTLCRKQFRDDGIFGDLLDEAGVLFAQTLEHSYDKLPKVPAGVYSCVRGQHQLEGHAPFETFEITGVPGHTGVLFHQGNWNRDSSGCVLLGGHVVLQQDGTQMLTDSALTFHEFMDALTGIDQFTLTVKNAP